VGLSQGVDDINVLGALGETRSTGNTGVGPFPRRHIALLVPPGITFPFVKGHGTIVNTEYIWNGYPIRAGHTVAAARTGDGHLFTKIGCGGGIGCQLRARKLPRVDLVRNYAVFQNLLTRTHAGKDRHYLIPVQDKAQSPVGGAPLLACGGKDAVHRFWDLCQGASPEGLHDDNSDILCRRILNTFEPRLILRVQIIILNLAEFPVLIAIDNPLKYGERIVERKADMANPALGFSPFQRLQAPIGSDGIPAFCIECMEEVKIDMVGAELCKLFREEPIPVRLTFNKPDRAFGCKI